MRVLGYVTSRSFQGLTIPVPAQNSCLREFAKAQKLVYVLPPLEHYFQNCYMQLFTVLKSMQDGDILAMYSAAMLPTNKKKLEFIFSELKYLDAKMHFVLESKTVKNLEEVKSLLFSYSLKNMFDKMYQIDKNSLRKLI
tara:strand:- start:1005 stop:1421 length:417 start_codon:yes stop_codon:yes gene_type:complete